MSGKKSLKIARSVAVCGIGLCSFAYAQDQPASVGKVQHNVVFSEYSTDSSNAEMARRLYTPLTLLRLNKRLAHDREKLSPQPIDLAQERFAIYIPAAAPPDGYGLLVFVPPWNEEGVPRGWPPALDQFGVIFVSAARSGNDQSVVGRRVPLALLAAANVMKQFKINPERVYVGGFSGGSRVALRLALAYPDLFRGALLNAGSDRIGESDMALPAQDLFLLFQSRTRLVYATGGDDRTVLAKDSASISSMHEWCVAGVSTQPNPDIGHDVLNFAVFDHAMRRLLEPVAPDASELADCRLKHEQELTERVQTAQSLAAAGKTEEATQVLTEIDARFGGLETQEALDLDAKLGLDAVK